MQHLGHINTKVLFVAYLKFTFNGDPSLLLGPTLVPTSCCAFKPRGTRARGPPPSPCSWDPQALVPTFTPSAFTGNPIVTAAQESRASLPSGRFLLKSFLYQHPGGHKTTTAKALHTCRCARRRMPSPRPPTVACALGQGQPPPDGAAGCRKQPQKHVDLSPSTLGETWKPPWNLFTVSTNQN